VADGRKVDDIPVAPDALWWPAMNFDQFRWDGTEGRYALEFVRDVFVRRLADAYAQCVRELREDDRSVPDQDPSPLRAAGYPALDVVLEDADARFELVRVYLYEDIFTSFLPGTPSDGAIFMINSVDEVASSPQSVIIRGRGYHGGPGFGEKASTAAR
jgi:hypothetical protein